MSLSILKNELKSGIIRNLYLFYGPEEYLKKYYLASIEDKLLSDDLREMNSVVLEGRIDVERLKDYCSALPMFSDRKMVIVKNSGLFKSRKKSEEEDSEDAGVKARRDEMSEFLQNVPSYTCLVFYEDEIDKKPKIIDVIKKNGLVVEFEYQEPMELAKWVIRAFKNSNKIIDPVTASMLVENSEQGMTEILNEVNKVILFVGERTQIVSDDIEKVCTRSIKSRIFDLMDAAAQRDCSKALKLLNDMIALKEPVPKIFFMLVRQLKHVLQMKLLKAEGISTNEAMSRMGITPYAARKLEKQIKGFSVDMLKDAIKESLELDAAVKSGRLDDRMAVELLITKVSR